MKKTLLILLTIGFLSCSKDENILEEDLRGKLYFQVQFPVCENPGVETYFFLQYEVDGSIKSKTFPRLTPLVLPAGTYSIKNFEVLNEERVTMYRRPSSEGSHVIYLNEKATGTINLKVKCK